MHLQARAPSQLLPRKSCQSQPESSQSCLRAAVQSLPEHQAISKGFILASDYPFNTNIFPMDCNEVSKKPLELAQGCRRCAKSWGSHRAKAVPCLLARVSTALLSFTSCLLHIHHTGTISFFPFSSQEKLPCCSTAVTLLPGTFATAFSGSQVRQYIHEGCPIASALNSTSQIQPFLKTALLLKVWELIGAGKEQMFPPWICKQQSNDKETPKQTIPTNKSGMC